jgi:uncharacterized membrane protein YuzA (DUF378 family)
VPFNFTPDSETPLDISLLCLLLIGLVIGFVSIMLSVGDLEAAKGQKVAHNPTYTAALQSVVNDSIRATVLIALLGLVTTRLLDRALTGQAIFYSVIYTIVAISMIFFVNLYFRSRIRREAAALIDPCAECPFEHSPFREIAKANRARNKPIVVSEDATGIHITIDPREGPPEK